MRSSFDKHHCVFVLTLICFSGVKMPYKNAINIYTLICINLFYFYNEIHISEHTLCSQQEICIIKIYDIKVYKGNEILYTVISILLKYNFKILIIMLFGMSSI